MGLKLVVIASGRGTNFSAIAQAVQSGKIPHSQVVSLITHNPKAEAVTRAKKLGIPFQLLDDSDRSAYHQKLSEALTSLAPDYICLAGYLRLLPADVVLQWNNRILNIHPSLLPAFKGLKAQKQALEHGVAVTGCTVHFVTEGLDDGPILAQRALEIKKEDTEESLSARLQPLEHEAYVDVLRRLATERYELNGRRVVWKSGITPK